MVRCIRKLLCGNRPCGSEANRRCVWSCRRNRIDGQPYRCTRICLLQSHRRHRCRINCRKAHSIFINCRWSEKSCHWTCGRNGDPFARQRSWCESSQIARTFHRYWRKGSSIGDDTTEHRRRWRLLRFEHDDDRRTDRCART